MSDAQSAEITQSATTTTTTTTITTAVAAPDINALEARLAVLRDERSACWDKLREGDAQIEKIEKAIECVRDAELAKERAVQLEKDGHLIAFEPTHERFFEHLRKIVPDIQTRIVKIEVTIEGWHLTGSEGVENDSCDIDVGTLTVSGVRIPKDLRRVVNPQMLMAFIEEDNALSALCDTDVMRALTYTPHEDWTGDWVGELPVYVVVKSDRLEEANGKGNKRAKKEK